MVPAASRIASENYASPAVLAAQGSCLTNKYAEGYPGKRYYGGCEFVDVVEQLAIDRLKTIFGAPFANVQPHSGSQANQAVYAAVLSPGDTLLGMSLASGGHLTHGAAVNLSGKLYHAVAYGLNEQEEIDYAGVDRLAREQRPKIIVAGASAYSRVIDWRRFRSIADFVTSTTHKTLRGPRGGFILAAAAHEKAINSMIFPGIQGGPLMHVIAAKAVAFGEALKPEFKTYQQQILANARAMAVTLQRRGLRIVSGGTDCHMFLVDLRPKNITGKDAEAVLGRAHITLNKNAIPNDPQKPMVTSGVRIGSPAITTRGFGVVEAEQVATLLADVLEDPQSEATVRRVAAEVEALCARYPVYGKAAASAPVAG